MQKILPTLLGFILLATPLAATAQHFTYSYSSDGSAITITGYTGPGGAVTIPDTIFGLPVTRIGDYAFNQKPGLSSVTIPGSVTSIGSGAFSSCTSLASATIPNGVTSIGDYAFFNCTSLTSVTIPGSVTSMGAHAFAVCTSLASITIPGSVTRIEDAAFYDCTSLKGVFFMGNAPSINAPSIDTFVFPNGTNPTIYYLPGTTGWGATFAGRPTSLWNPVMLTSGPSFGVGPAGFGFTITGTADIPIVVEASTDLATASWLPLQGLNLTNGLFYFSDPNWMNYPARSYRIRSP